MKRQVSTLLPAAVLTALFAAVFGSTLFLSACSERAVPPERRADEPKETAVNFVNKVWRVRESSGVAPGQLYVFLSEGTLVMASPNGKPAFGTWKDEGGALTVVEEGISYKVDVLNLSQDEFRIRSNNPGGAVEITLVPAEGSPPPK